MKHIIETILPTSCNDIQGNLYPDLVLTLFQQAADAHSNLMGIGFETIRERHLLWVVVQIRYEVLQKAEPGQKITVTTWPLPASRLGYERNYLIHNEKGELLLKGTSLWVLIDSENRSLVIGADVYPKGEYYTEKIFTDRTRRLQNFESETPALEVVPDQSLIDRNGHVNNTKYAMLAIKALKQLPGTLKSFQIDYIHEVLCGQKLSLYSAIKENSILVKGESEDGTRMFACSITIAAVSA